jgi:polysaccharide deacetylase family protein (PEP-CTERM system associated)
MKNALTIDLEEYFQIHVLSDLIEPRTWDTLPSSIVENSRKILELLQMKGISATFFCLGWIAEHNKDLIREIHDQGHEIACHGYSHQAIYRQNAEEFKNDVYRAKGTLEDIIGEKVLGYRAPTYSITGKTLWALDILEELGFRYDSSIFPIYHDNYGIPDAPRFPHLIQGRSLVEFPITTVKIGPLNLPISGGGYFRLLPYPLIKLGLGSMRSSNMPFIFYIHPWEINPETPFVPGMDLFSRFRTYIGIQKAYQKFSRLIDDFSFAPVHAVLKEMGMFQEPGIDNS